MSLAILEYLCGFGDRSLVPSDLVLVSASFPDAALIDATGSVPLDWRTVPATVSCARFGDEWLKNARSLALIVPSVAIPPPPLVAERNVLFNPVHPRESDAVYGEPREIRLDERLVSGT